MTFLIGQSENVTSWLTPVWLICCGILLGFLIVLAIWGLLLALSTVRGLNTIYESPNQRRIAGGILSMVFFAIFFAITFSKGYWSQADLSDGDYAQHVVLMIVFYVSVSLALGLGLIAAVSRKRRHELKLAPRDGFLYWTSIVCIVAGIFAVLGFALSAVQGFGMLLFVENPNQFVDSFVQLPSAGERRVEFQIPLDAPETGMVAPGVSFDGRRLTLLRIKTNQPLEIASSPITDQMSIENYLSLAPDPDKYLSYLKKPTDDSRFPDRQIDEVYIANRGNDIANVTFRWEIGPDYPQVAIVAWMAGFIISIYLVYFLFLASMPKIFAVAQATFKTEVSQPVFIILVLIGIVFAVGSIYIPYNTFGEDIKMYKDSGLTLIRVLGIFLAVWAASKSVAEEIEGRTALTVLSKPVSRRQFLLGKYFGIAMAIGLLFLIVGLWFVFWTAYKPIYDSGESTIRDFTWQNSFKESVTTMPGLVLAYFEALIFAAISVVISTRMGILANFMICFSIYVLGHLTPLIVQSNEVVQAFEGVTTFGYVISAILPVLDHFDINAAITGEVDVPLSYLGWSAIYTFLYGLVAMLLALALFEDRDLA